MLVYWRGPGVPGISSRWSQSKRYASNHYFFCAVLMQLCVLAECLRHFLIVVDAPSFFVDATKTSPVDVDQPTIAHISQF